MSASGRGSLSSTFGDFLTTRIHNEQCALPSSSRKPFECFMTIHRTTVFMQDSAPCHKAKSVKLWIREQGFDLLQWPPQSPDLNPIENLWSEMKHKAAAQQFRGIQELVDFLKNFGLLNSPQKCARTSSPPCPAVWQLSSETKVIPRNTEL